MTDKSNETRPELERLRAENEKLRKQAEKTGEPQTGNRERARHIWTTVLVLMAAAMITISVPALWLNRVVLDTDTWVETVGPLASEPAIQDALSSATANAIIDEIDSQGVADRYLPEELSLFAGPISQAVDDFIRAQTEAIVRSEEFATIWEETNRIAHGTIVAAITGREGVVNVEAGTVAVDTGLLAEQVQDRLSAAGLTVVDQIPVGRLSGQFVLFESRIIGRLSGVFDAIDRMALVLPLLGLTLAAGAIGLSSDRRKTVLWLGVGIIVAGLLPLQAIYLGQYYVVTQLQSLGQMGTAAGEAAYTIIFRDLISAERSLAFVGLFLWVGALIAGPARWATVLRSGLTSGIADTANHLELGAVGTWVATHMTALRTTGLVVAGFALLALPAPRTIAEITWIAAVVLVWMGAVEVFGTSRHRPPDTERLT